MARNPPVAFTLIELLVVITIIVILASLLSPAIDRAIYLTQLVTCAATQRALGGGAQSYAAGNGRTYPDRGADLQFSGGEPDVVFHPLTGSAPGSDAARHDLRKMMGGYIPINKTMNDPFVRAVDFEQTESDVCFGAYNMYFGHSMAPAGERGMMKLGAHWTYTPDDGVERHFRVLAMDKDLAEPDNNNTVHHAHPDYDGILTNFVWQGTLPTGTDGGLIPEVDGVFNGKFILSIWVGPPRGLTDANAVAEDGSVQRYDRYPWNAGAPDPGHPGSTFDPRFVRVISNVHDNSTDNGYNNVPAP